MIFFFHVDNPNYNKHPPEWISEKFYHSYLKFKENSNFTVWIDSKINVDSVKCKIVNICT